MFILQWCPTVLLPVILTHSANSLFTQCYKIVGDDNKSWQEARKYCINQGGNLVSILSEREQGERYQKHVANIRKALCGCL